MLGMNETMDPMAMADGVCLYGHVMGSRSCLKNSIKV